MPAHRAEGQQVQVSGALGGVDQRMTGWRRGSVAMRLLKMLLLVLCVCAAGPAVAGPLEDAAAAYWENDYATALRLFRPLADQGNAIAQVGLGSMYERGDGVPQDFVAAVTWYRKAADQGYPIAQRSLGLMYDLGRGVPQDYVQAHKWYNLAASRFAAWGKDNFDRAVKDRDGVAVKMTPAQIAEAQKLAREWRPKQ